LLFRPENIDPSPVASFTWHKAPITSIEWHPTEESIFAAGAANDEAGMHDTPTEEGEVPHQLMFMHQGQKDVKEVHWHPQIPGLIISTALDGFNIFKTVSV
jgi:ribosome assembly protein RRB1